MQNRIVRKVMFSIVYSYIHAIESKLFENNSIRNHIYLSYVAGIIGAIVSSMGEPKYKEQSIKEITRYFYWWKIKASFLFLK